MRVEALRRFCLGQQWFCLMVPLLVIPSVFGFSKGMLASEAGTYSDGVNPAMPGIYDSPFFAQIIVVIFFSSLYIVPGILIGALLGWGFSNPLGALFYSLRASAHTPPPPDGYDAVKSVIEELESTLEIFSDDRAFRNKWRKTKTDMERYVLLRDARFALQQNDNEHHALLGKRGEQGIWAERLEGLLPPAYQIRLPEDFRIPYVFVDVLR